MFQLNRFLAVMAVAALAALPSPAWAERVRVTLLLVCDIYQMSANADGRGGLAKVAAVIRREREGNPNVIAVHAGDAISPSLMSGLDQGAHMIDLLNGIGLDAFVPGNHEFDFGPDVFRARMAEAKFPVLAGNLAGEDGAPIPNVTADRLVELGGIRVGLAGFTAEDSVTRSSPGDLKFTPTLDGSLTATAALRKAGADLVVQVVHAPRNVDMELVREGSADIILSGDDHDLLVSYDGRTAFAEAMQDGWYVVAVDVDVDVSDKDGKRRVSWWPNFRVIDTATVEPDPDMAARVAAYEAKLSEQLDRPLTKTATLLDSRNAAVRGGEATIGNLFADALRASMGADIALVNGGGFRGNRSYEPGTQLTRRDVLRELPFGNKAYLLELSGAQLRSVLEQAFAKAERLTGAFPQVSGLTIRADVTRPAGDRVVSVSVNGKPLDAAATYTLATNDFLARGGDGYEALKQTRQLVGATDAKLLAELIMARLGAQDEVAPSIEQRIVVGRSAEPQ
jgi:2',3'-cyclic-nucleotide 2'-phosphodiesterase (5'-nucleotidase family)